MKKIGGGELALRAKGPWSPSVLLAFIDELNSTTQQARRRLKRGDALGCLSMLFAAAALVDALHAQLHLAVQAGVERAALAAMELEPKASQEDGRAYGLYL